MGKQLRNLLSKEELIQRLKESEEARTTLSFYRYHQLEDPQAFRDWLFEEWSNLGVFGRIYIASEGINGQISVPTENFGSFKNHINGIDWLEGARLNIAIEDDGKSFYKLKIKVRQKIVADGLNDDSFDVTKRGRHLSATEVNELMEKEETVIVDMRNHYESEVGYFEGAIRPDVETFRESLPIVEDLLGEDKERPIVMYCTGGIRCEKASAYYLHRGYNNVNMIDGGIIEYSRQCEEKGLENHFVGKNFVFDERMGESISGDIVARCHQCGEACDDHINCAIDACHLLFIQCKACAEKFDQCCSSKCKGFRALPEEEQMRLRPNSEFNGTKFGKGRYKAFRTDEGLFLE